MIPPTFGGESYRTWTFRMQTYMEDFYLWEAVEYEYILAPLLNNQTMAQINNHQERKIRKSKAKACLFAAILSIVFTHVMSLKFAK